MIYPGIRINTVARCPACGLDMGNNSYPESTFLLLACRNPECSNVGVGLIVEKATMTVLHVSCIFIDGEPAYPAAWVNRKGESVPKARK